MGTVGKLPLTDCQSLKYLSLCQISALATQHRLQSSGWETSTAKPLQLDPSMYVCPQGPMQLNLQVTSGASTLLHPFVVY
jgi:hypothetical protein